LHNRKYNLNLYDIYTNLGEVFQDLTAKGKFISGYRNKTTHSTVVLSSTFENNFVVCCNIFGENKSKYLYDLYHFLKDIILLFCNLLYFMMYFFWSCKLRFTKLKMTKYEKEENVSYFLQNHWCFMYNNFGTYLTIHIIQV
jgi:hypothetical protein